jgi:hypothetical protein
MTSKRGLRSWVLCDDLDALGYLLWRRYLDDEGKKMLFCVSFTCHKRFGCSEQESTRIFLCFEGVWRDSEACCISGVGFSSVL